MTFLAVDGLNPSNEKQSSAIRQMLHQFEKKEQVKERAKIVKSTDQCFKCGELGHWAAQCMKNIPHDPAWLAKQQCYACGQAGHLKKDCKNTSSQAAISTPKCTSKNSKSKVKIYLCVIVLHDIL